MKREGVGLSGTGMHQDLNPAPILFTLPDLLPAKWLVQSKETHWGSVGLPQGKRLAQCYLEQSSVTATHRRQCLLYWLGCMGYRIMLPISAVH